MMLPFNYRVRKSFGILMAAAIVFALGMSISINASDHADSPGESVGNLDVSDLYVFTSMNQYMVFAMTVSPLLTPGSATDAAAFNPDGLYQFKIDTDGDGVEEGVMQITFSGSDTSQTVEFRGPAAPPTTGATKGRILSEEPATGDFNTTFTAGNGSTIFAGPRDDPFFVHLLGDSSLTSVLNSVFDIGSPQTLAFSNPGIDDLAGLNCLAIVAQVPKAELQSVLGIGPTDDFFVWATTSIKDE
jgi:hypothetical protein